MANWTPEQKKWLKRYLKKKVDQPWNFWPPRLEARRRAASKRYGMQICCVCKGEFMRADTDVDHIDPTVQLDKEGFEDPGEYIERKYCQVENLRVICKPCHYGTKTKIENAERAKHRAARKLTKKQSKRKKRK